MSQGHSNRPPALDFRATVFRDADDAQVLTDDAVEAMAARDPKITKGWLAAQLRRRLGSVAEGVLSVFLRKVWTLLLTPPASLVVIAIRLMRPLVLIRFGPLASYRIGHFSADTEVYLCERDAGMHGQRTLDVFYHMPPVCNQQLKKMWDRTLHVCGLASLPDRLNRRLPGGQYHVIPWRKHQARDIHGLLAKTQTHLSFTPEEELQGQLTMRELGIPDGSPFVCFLGRDSAYLESIDPQFEARWGITHDFRDMPIHDYVPAAEEMVRRGYFALRIGSIVKEALATNNPKIIDYATKGRTDFMDIYLSAKCRFFVSCGSGLDGVATSFRRPVAFVNYVPLDWAASWDPTHVMIPKRLWLQQEGRFLTFREILGSPVGRFRNTAQYEELGIEVMENTPQEIVAVAVEMEERLKGTWQTTEEDEELQARFWSLFTPGERHGVFMARIGAEFLRHNQELLD